MKATEVNHPTVTSEAPDRRVGEEGTTAGERERARLERLSLYVRTAQTILRYFVEHMPPELQECFLRPRRQGVNLCSVTVAYTPNSVLFSVII